ncbi:peptidyl-prolyl cis-trans isomerase A (cyclophilin A) [Novosphingobium sp. Rr 2-17]|uniref:peptidylprolyl isomerase n=1 Tax=Novosphingobium sp. Rr 2-17 TaxID=555793 RepID=UPI0002698184|nr:peptidylprolyl isomerase [Novosphingobium sp. Rr 2-17]EIZ80771.1 peptidyl-prolyl cis-trans isomerase A (cyclophilin A) [Novosphingobium sp. Rr 2-17]
MRRLAGLLAGAMALAVASVASAQPVAAQAVTAPQQAEHVYVALVTATGTITLDLDKGRAPLTVANFLKYVDTKRFDGAVFYRAMHLNWGEGPSGLLQGGIRDNAAKLLPSVAHEPTDKTGILHKAGTISMARFAPGSAKADFTIMISDMPALDADPKGATEDARAGFAAFGHVVGGMDLVRSIWDTPRSATAGEGAMKGDMLVAPVKILSARRVPAPPPPVAPTSAAPAPTGTP